VRQELSLIELRADASRKDREKRWQGKKLGGENKKSEKITRFQEGIH